ncbi:AAA family ATPase [Methylomonas sp. EFPC3]|uniref:AAA family ATPase n=1 Tax=Methylomonas sp. EFPC3 TaxID=3021710 RepID=UPI002417BFF1|nr:AAA family ATPase [Methylomonas sp. EFPC3]WFP51729.1 AAA family ATPase [Methylomonas sp. EFPC3]
MKINKLELLYFRCFKEYQLELSDRFTLLIGNNGKGKTAILDALAIILSEFIEGFPRVISSKDLRKFYDDDCHFDFLAFGQTPLRERHHFLSLKPQVEINQETFTCVLFDRYGPRYSRTITELAKRISEKVTELQTLLPILAYYGTGRLWKELDDSEIQTLSPDSRLVGYRDCLNPASNIEQLFRWFKTQELAALQKNETRHVLEAVRNAIIEMIPEAKGAKWDFDWDEILIETEVQGKTQPIPFHLLSDGYRNMIGMVADIAYRMATLNPQLEADVIKQTEGIVLIDEIDLHLHPKWQREVVGRLLSTFPKVQFVASSHSPFIIQSLYGRDDCLLWDLEKACPINIESESIEDIAEDQQHVDMPQKSKRYLDMMAAAEAYYRRLHQVNDESDQELLQLRSRLDELSIPFSDDPAFAAQLKFERDSVLAAKNK